jgi:hypothetical protein
MPYSLLEVQKLFGGTHHLYPQCGRISQAWTKISTRFHAALFIGLLIGPERVADMFNRNVGGYWPNYISLQSWRLYFSTKLTKLKELSCSWETSSLSATCLRISQHLWNPKVHYCVHKSSPLTPVLSQINPVQSSFFFKIRFHIILPRTTWRF